MVWSEMSIRHGLLELFPRHLRLHVAQFKIPYVIMMGGALHGSRCKLKPSTRQILFLDALTVEPLSKKI